MYLQFCVILFQVNREDSDLQFNVYHKHVTDFEFRKMSVRNNRSVTLQDVLLGEEYEVCVSSVEVSTGKMSPLSRGLAIGEKDVTLMAILNVHFNEYSVRTFCMCVYMCLCVCALVAVLFYNYLG